MNRKKSSKTKKSASSNKSADSAKGLTPEQKQALELVKTCIAGVTVGYIPLKQLQDALEQFKLSLEKTKTPWD